MYVTDKRQETESESSLNGDLLFPTHLVASHHTRQSAFGVAVLLEGWQLWRMLV